MYLQPNAHQGHGRGEQPQETLVEATLKGAWKGSKHSRPHEVAVVERRCRRALAASCPADARLVLAPRPSELDDLAAPVCTSISTHSKNNFCVCNYPDVAQEEAAWQRAPRLERSFLQSPAAALSQAEGTVPPEQAHSLVVSVCILHRSEEKCWGESKSHLYSLREKGSGRNSCSAIAFALLQSLGLPMGLSFGSKRLPDLMWRAHSSHPACCGACSLQSPPPEHTPLVTHPCAWK